MNSTISSIVQTHRLSDIFSTNLSQFSSELAVCQKLIENLEIHRLGLLLRKDPHRGTDLIWFEMYLVREKHLLRLESVEECDGANAARYL